MKIQKDSDDWKEMQEIVQTLIEKRLIEYPLFNRLVLDYEFIQLDASNYNLNVISSLSLD
jgi:hypothetical protein